MRGNTRQRPNSQHGAQISYAQQASSHAPRKIFNCIVDDTALVAGVKKSTRNGIRHWVKQGQIRLFVPLHALEQLSRQKSANTKHGEDVRDTLQWLDDATTKYPHAITLQGGDQYYSNWAEVERFTVPRTLFSENDHLDGAVEHTSEYDGLPDATEAKLTLDDMRTSPVSSAASVGSASAAASSMQSVRSSVSPEELSPPTSPAKAASSPAKQAAVPEHAAAPIILSGSASVPFKLQPLFNFILWRIHQELDPIAALESFIFLCNDPGKVHYAKGFDIRCKRLEQLREAIVREDRDYRNRLSMHKQEDQQAAAIEAAAPTDKQNEDDEVVFKPLARAAAATAQNQQPNVIDPNAFGRTPQPEQTSMVPKSPRFQSAQPNGRGGLPAPFTPRGNGMRGNFRGSQRGRGNVGLGRAGFAPNTRVLDDVQPHAQIDPNSFERPRGGGYAARGGRKLWVPT